MADKEERNSGKAKPSMPAGATNMKKNMAAGMSMPAAAEKSLTKSQVEKKER